MQLIVSSLVPVQYRKGEFYLLFCSLSSLWIYIRTFLLTRTLEIECTLMTSKSTVAITEIMLLKCVQRKTTMNRLAQRTSGWDLPIRFGMALVLHIGEEEETEYEENGMTLKSPKSARDVGVVVDANLNFEGHIITSHIITVTYAFISVIEKYEIYLLVLLRRAFPREVICTLLTELER